MQYTNVRIQHLFVFFLALKVASSLASWYFQSPWVLGLALPLLCMTAYMVTGYYRREKDVSDEKFADSCYYMGFIFTITSIIVCLFDLPRLNPQDGFGEIAVRFGAAMVSTVLGMGVRVALVSFKKDADDAVRDAEDAVIDAVRMLTVQLNSVVDGLKIFEDRVIDATNTTVANVDKQVEKLSTDYSDSLKEFYQQITDENRAAFQKMLDEVRVATARLGKSVETYAGGMNAHLSSVEMKVTQFSDAVAERLRQTTFPDDYFAQQLAAPIEQFKTEAARLGSNVRDVAGQVVEASTEIGTALKTIGNKSKKAQAAMEAVVNLAEQHKIILDNANNQLAALSSVALRLSEIEDALRGSLVTINSNTQASADLVTRVQELTQGGREMRLDVKAAIDAATSKLDANAMLATGVIEKVEAQAASLRDSAIAVIASLEQSTNASRHVSQLIESSVNELKTISGATVDAAAGIRDTAAEVTHAADGATRGANMAAQTASESANTIRNLAATIGLRADGLLKAAQHLRDSNQAQLNAVAEAVRKALSSQPESPVRPPMASLSAQYGQSRTQATGDLPLVQGGPMLNPAQAPASESLRIAATPTSAPPSTNSNNPETSG